MHQSIHLLLLVVSFALLCSQLLVRQKQLVHLLFAAFCGSVCLMAIKRLGGADLGLGGRGALAGPPGQDRQTQDQGRQQQEQQRVDAKE